MIASLPKATPETRRGIQFERLFRIADKLRGLRFGIELEDLVAEVSEATGHDWHERTITRDLELLEYLGVVDFDNRHCKWRDGKQLLAGSPTAIGQAVDTVTRRQSPQCFDVVNAGIADLVRQVIKESGRSANAIAKAAGVPQNCLSRFIRGGGTLSLPAIERLASYFGLQLQPGGES